MDMKPTSTESLNNQPTLSLISSTEIKDKTEDLRKKINMEIDKIFGPAIQRNRSASDVEIVAPIRHKKQQYWSHERLFAEKPLQVNQSFVLSNTENLNFDINELTPSDSRIPILHENQRAEIVASVTERLYSKLKKNEKSKMESVIDKKSMHPLNELKICSNARQRLVDISHKAVRNKRKIGIPAWTQTKKHVTRMKNQGIEAQIDLQSIVTCSSSYALHKDASTETISVTPRLKDNATGTNIGMLKTCEKATATENKTKTFKNSMIMTDVVLNCDHSTQTQILPNSRMKKKMLHVKKYKKILNSLRSVNDNSLSPTININITPIIRDESYSSQEISEDEKEQNITHIKTSLDNTVKSIRAANYKNNCTEETKNNNIINENIYPIDIDERVIELSEEENFIIPRVMVDPDRQVDLQGYKELILGQSKDAYPYNLKLSPYKKLDGSTKVNFKDINTISEQCSSTSRNDNCNIKTFNSLTLVEHNNFDIKSDTKKDVNKIYKTNDNERKYHGRAKSIDSKVDKSNNILNSTFAVYSNNLSVNRSIRGYNNINHRQTPTEYLNYLIQIRREAVATKDTYKYEGKLSL